MNGSPTPPSAGHDADALLDCEEAAARLGVSAAALTRWSQRLQFPENRGPADDPCFRRVEIEVLREELTRAWTIPGAIRAARERLGEAD